MLASLIFGLNPNPKAYLLWSRTAKGLSGRFLQDQCLVDITITIVLKWARLGSELRCTIGCPLNLQILGSVVSITYHCYKTGLYLAHSMRCFCMAMQV